MSSYIFRRCAVFFCAGYTLAAVNAASVDEALKLSKAGKHSESERMLTEVVSRNSGDSLAWFNLGNALFRQEKFLSASKAYRKVIALRSPLANPATLYLVKSLRFQDKLDEALTIAKSLKNKKIFPNLRKQLDLEIAEIQEAQKLMPLKSSFEAYEKENYAQALEKAKEAMKKEASEEAYLLRAMAELQLGMEREAERTLLYIQNKGKDADIKREAAGLLEDLRMGLWKHPGNFFASIDFAGGYNSNIFTNGKSEDASSSTITRTFINTGYTFSREKSFSSLLAYQFFWEEVFKDSDERSMSHSLLFPLGTERGTWFFQGIPKVSYLMLGSDPYVAKGGASGKIQKRLASTQYLSLGLEGEYTHALEDSYSYLEGSYYEASLGYQNFFDRSDIEVILTVSKENIGSQDYAGGGMLPLSNMNYGLSMAYHTKFSGRFNFELGISYFFKKFDSETLPDNIIREDKTLNVWSRLSYLQNAKLSYYFAPSYTYNQSNLGAMNLADKNYNQWVALLGVEWKVFQ